MFSREYLNNPAFTGTVLSFTKQLPERICGAMIQTGTMVQENGDVLFRFCAPEAGSLRVQVWKKTVSLKKDGNGLWTGVLPYDPAYTGLDPTNIFRRG